MRKDDVYTKTYRYPWFYFISRNLATLQAEILNFPLSVYPWTSTFCSSQVLHFVNVYINSPQSYNWTAISGRVLVSGSSIFLFWLCEKFVAVVRRRASARLKRIKVRFKQRTKTRKRKRGRLSTCRAYLEFSFSLLHCCDRIRWKIVDERIQGPFCTSKSHIFSTKVRNKW